MVDLALVDVAANLHHLEPAEMTQCHRGLFDRAFDRLGDALVGRADQLDDLVDWLCHCRSFPGTGRSRASRRVGVAVGCAATGSYSPSVASMSLVTLPNG